MYKCKLHKPSSTDLAAMTNRLRTSRQKSSRDCWTWDHRCGSLTHGAHNAMHPGKCPTLHNSLFVPLACMCGIGLRRHGLHDDGHEAMQGPTELGALPVEDALALDEGVDAVDAARRGVRLDAERGHREAVEDVLPRDEEADVSAGRQSESFVHLEITHHAWLQVLVRDQVALELVERGNLGPVQVLLGSGVVLRLDVLHLRPPVRHA